MRLRDGSTVEDSRLDRLQQWDERSRKFPVRAIVGGLPLRSRGWWLPTILDQGQEGACVGFSLAHELLSSPLMVKRIDGGAARSIYKEAQTIDEWAGDQYEGTSVLAGAKVCQSRGFFTTYRWGFSLEDALLAIGYEGPVVFGLPWYGSMLNPDSRGYLQVNGDVVGGHAICGVGVHLRDKRVVVANSWSDSWGRKGRAYITFDDLDRLLHEGGECLVPMGRRQP